MRSSDAELRVGQRLSGVLPWETQLGSINELTGSNLLLNTRGWERTLDDNVAT